MTTPTQGAAAVALHRRTVLRWLGWLGLGAAAGIGTTLDATAHAAWSPAEELPLALLQRDGIAAIGREYLRSHDSEASAEALARSLGLSSASLEGSEIEALRTRLADQVRDDFRVDHTVNVSGWILSRTEVRLAALIAVWRPGRT
jgi:hypothetical protein